MLYNQDLKGNLCKYSEVLPNDLQLTNLVEYDVMISQGDNASLRLGIRKDKLSD